MKERTHQVPFLLGGCILDRRYPSILEYKGSARTMSHEEWTNFCNDFESAMSWEKNWRRSILNWPVMISLACWLVSVALLILTRDDVSEILWTRGQANITTTTTEELSTNQTVLLLSPRSSPSFYRAILPDICVFLLLVLMIALAVSLVRMSIGMQENAAQVCQDYTQQYQDFCGITLEVDRHAGTLAQSPWRQHQHYARHTRRADNRSFIKITKTTKAEATSRYQNISGALLHPQHPNDEMGEPPFFDVSRVPRLLPPQNQPLVG